MKTIQRTFPIYTFNELEPETQERVKSWCLEGQESSVFTRMIKDDLAIIFPNSEPEIQYSLSYSQGDGFNISGWINFMDLLEVLKGHFTMKEIRTLKFYFDQCDDGVTIPHNIGDCYCSIYLHDITTSIINDLTWWNYTGINFKLLEKFEKLSQDYIAQLCADYKKAGYSFFYEVENADLAEWCNSNEYYFLADGTIYYEQEGDKIA